jgi:hypothetical protein
MKLKNDSILDIAPHILIIQIGLVARLPPRSSSKATLLNGWRNAMTKKVLKLFQIAGTLATNGCCGQGLAITFWVQAQHFFMPLLLHVWRLKSERIQRTRCRKIEVSVVLEIRVQAKEAYNKKKTKHFNLSD